MRETKQYCYSNRTWRDLSRSILRRGAGFHAQRKPGVGAKVLEKSLSRLENSQSTPPFSQLYFLLRLILREILLNSRIMPGKAFCGNGFIHLNIAEIHEEHIGGQK